MKGNMRTSDILFPEVEKVNRQNLMELKMKLQKTKRKESWMMCLGAGVSISVGLPNWHKLLAIITAQIFPIIGEKEMLDSINSKAYYKGIKQFYKDLTYENKFLEKYEDSFKGKYTKTFENINMLEAAEYILNYLKGDLEYSSEDASRNGGDFQKRVYFHMNYLIQQACKFEGKVDISNPIFENTTLAAVARLMKTEKDDLIHNVITYNYDNLLEEYLRNICKCDSKCVHSIVKKDELRDFGNKKEWNIYHVHGRVPVVPHSGEDMSDNIILTESDYYQEEQINYSWTNILQSYAMLRSNLIFIGFSGADYNFRRLIKYVNQENAMPHERYIFFAVDDIARAVFNEGKDVNDCVNEMEKKGSEYSFEKLFINYLIHAQTVYWEKHGMKVIWSSHKELYDDLEKLH
ncbi:SIR2 family protein [Lachnospiraceae bacterium 42-17]